MQFYSEFSCIGCSPGGRLKKTVVLLLKVRSSGFAGASDSNEYCHIAFMSCASSIVNPRRHTKNNTSIKKTKPGNIGNATEYMKVKSTLPTRFAIVSAQASSANALPMSSASINLLMSDFTLDTIMALGQPTTTDR